MLPPLQAPSSHTSRPPCCPHLSSLHSGQREPFPCKSESCLSSEETPKVSLLTRSTSTPTSTRGQASPTKGLLRFHLTLLSTAPARCAAATWAPPVSGTASGLALCLGCPPPTEPHGSGSHSPKVPIQRSLFRKYLPCSFHMKQPILSLPSSLAHWACFTFSSFSCCLH